MLKISGHNVRHMTFLWPLYLMCFFGAAIQYNIMPPLALKHVMPVVLAVIVYFTFALFSMTLIGQHTWIESPSLSLRLKIRAMIFVGAMAYAVPTALAAHGFFSPWMALFALSAIFVGLLVPAQRRKESRITPSGGNHPKVDDRSAEQKAIDEVNKAYSSWDDNFLGMDYWSPEPCLSTNSRHFRNFYPCLCFASEWVASSYRLTKYKTAQHGTT
jgi:hypothetical protein